MMASPNVSVSSDDMFKVCVVFLWSVWLVVVCRVFEGAESDDGGNLRWPSMMSLYMFLGSTET